MSVLKFPGEPVSHSAMMAATRWQILQHRVLELLCVTLQRLGVPGAIQNVEIDDPVTGQKLEIRVNRLSTRISIDGRDYYFERLSGRFSGAGYATQHAGCRTQGGSPGLGPGHQEGSIPSSPTNIVI